MYYLGIDTSNYTTSVAVIDSQGKLIFDNRRLLQVPKGEHGLRQSEALFQHVKAFPEIYKLPASVVKNLSGVAVSTHPRDVEGSYMPIFVVGSSFARTISTSLGIPLIGCSHQHNHLAAGLWSVGWWPKGKKFLAVHLSGGTSEILEVDWDEPPIIKILGETRDLNAGQFIDRIGVALGLTFPAGPQLEVLAQTASGTVRLASPVDEMNMSFSGPLSAALRLIGDTEPAELARGVEDCVAKGVEKALSHAGQLTGHRQVLLVGGVMCNSRIRERLVQRLEHKAAGFKLHFAAPEASRDSAIGCAVLAWKKFKVCNE
jgi:N6-L-threonylcarbamoyladenine synthase